MVTTVLTETLHAGGFIVREGNGDISREAGVLTAGQEVVDGQVVALSGGKLIAATGGGGETIAGIIIGNFNVTEDTDVPYLARLATVKESAVKFHTLYGDSESESESEDEAAETATIKAALATKFIILR